MMSRDKVHPLGQDFTASSLLKFAFPTMVTMVFMGLYTIGDTILVSRFVSTDALSAVNIVTPVINLIVGLGSMLAMGGSAVIARKLGEGKKEEASQEFTLLLYFGAVLGGLIAGVGTLLCGEIIHSLGSGPRLFPYCRAYLSVLFLFTPASILQVLFQNLIIAAGRPGLGMALSVGAGLVNVLLDLIFMGMFHMGIAGSALGTGIGYLIPTAVGAAFFMRERGGISFRKPALHFQVLIESCANGCSELISQAAAAVTTFLFNRIMMGLLGEDGVAAVTIMIYSQFLLTTLYVGFSMGVSPVISYQLGAQNHRNLSRIMSICLTFIVSVSVFIFALSMTFGSALVTVFSPAGTPVYEIAAKGFPAFSFSFLFCGVGIFASAAFTALSDGKTSAFISFLRTFGLITLFLMILPDRLGVLGVWLSVPAAELAAMAVSIFCLKRAAGKKNACISGKSVIG